MPRRTLEPPSIAKITPPGGASPLARSRLQGAIDERGGRLFWISGPPGAGKTMLALAVASARREPLVWLRLDASDADPASFLAHLWAAATRAERGHRRRRPPLTAEMLRDLRAYARRYLRALDVASERLFVFDDVHEARGAIDEIFAVLAEELGPSARALLSSRDPLPEALARAVVSERALEIGADALCLDRAEVDEWRRAWRLEADAAALDRILERTRGWAAGVALCLRVAASEAAASLDALPRVASAYFQREVFGLLPASQREPLLEAAWLPYVTPELARALAPDGGLIECLRGLEAHSLFVLRHGTGGDSYSLHPFFAQFLRERGELTRGAEWARAQRDQTARVLVALGDRAAAIELWLEAGDVASVEPEIAGEAERLVEEVRVTTLVRWASAVPASARSPRLRYWLGRALLLVDTARGRAELAAAERAFAAEGARDWQVRALCYEISSYFLGGSSDLGPARAALDRLLALAPDPEAIADAEIRALVVLAVWNVLFMCAPEHPELARWRERVWRLLVAEGDPTVKMRLGMLLSWHDYYVGAYREISEARRALDATLNDPHLSPYGRLVWALLALRECWVRGAFDEGRSRLRDALAEASATSIHVLDTSLRIHGVCIALLDDDIAGARQLFAAIEASGSGESTYNRWQRLVHSAWLALLEGDPARALSIARDSAEAARPLLGSSPLCFSLIAEAYAALALGDGATAGAAIAALAARAASARNAFAQFHAHLLGARAAAHRGEHEREAAALRAGFALGRAQGFLHFPLALPSELAELAARALANGIEPGYARELILARRLAPPENARDSEAWPWPLRIEIFGGLRVARSGEPLAIAGRSQRRPLDILSALIALGGRNVDADVLSDALWPDSDGDAAQHALETGLHRLRKLVGKEAIRTRAGHVSLDERVVWLDLWALERELAAFERCARLGARGEVATRRERIRALHCGPAFGEATAPESVALRIRLERRVDRALRTPV